MFVRRILAPILLLTLLGCPRPVVLGPPTRPSDLGTGGAVASAESAATQAGLEILREGGSAADTAVAVALALAVVHPVAGNLGGGGFAVIKSGEEVTSLDFREIAPAAASRDMFLDPEGHPNPGASLDGPLAAGVPGSPTGLYELHRRYGRLPWPHVVAPALRLARHGFAVSRRLHDAIQSERQRLGHFPETAAVWLPGGEPPAVGAIMKLPELAATLQAYAGRGPAAIASGAVAAAIEATARAHGGILTATDLADYRAVWREPLRFRAFGWEFASMDLPSAGGIILGQTLSILERLGWDGMPASSTERDHVLLETWRAVYADRVLLGDVSNTRATSRQLLDPLWLALRAECIERARATPSSEVRPWPGAAVTEPGETTHLSVADGAGMLVSLTTTLNDWFGCGLYVPGAGFLLNNEMDDFTTAPGRANLFGLVQGDANAVMPRARMLSSMSPVIAWRPHQAIALGSRRGSRIPTAVAQVLLHLIVDGDGLQAAIDHPRIHHQWLPDEVVAEPGALDPRQVAELERRGHRVRLLEEPDLGEVHAVHLRPDGLIEAVADRRGPGAAGVAAPAPNKRHDRK